jgi:L-rhamnose mutarotase
VWLTRYIKAPGEGEEFRNPSSGKRSERRMIRKAFIMFLKPGYEVEYRRRHNPVWPELEQVLKRFGVSNYSIFLQPESERLFAYAEIESEELWQKIAETGECRRWWAFMKECMLTNPDDSPVAVELDEAFHLE